ncbi:MULTISPECIES: type III secretion system stator protein SctL [Dickeya]|uniref:Type III secretion system ATPase associated subunit HrpE n=1 Tax=Dickeya aquatica TaxID=1401087 RepID=A0A375AB59_9GAMM|nr:MULTISPECIES: type III secretion system stator protein SctL [Dickeya]SLM63265.1 Type III secretion system ATPase associated subunit HrpE [Dickeya aquatica]
MLTKRQLALVAGTDVQHRQVIPAGQLQQHQQGLTVMDAARQQAQVMLEEAAQQAQQAVIHATRQAEQQFWQQADDILHGWQQEREQTEAWLVSQCAQLLNEAMTQLLTAVPDAERYPALLRQLLRTQGGDGRGRLYCHPERQPEVSAWLAEHTHLGWTLTGDDSLPHDALKLVTPQGVMSLSWQQAVAQLLPATPPLSQPENAVP